MDDERDRAIDLPSNDEEAETMLSQCPSELIGWALVGLYGAYRSQGKTVLEAYDAALMRYIRVFEETSKENTHE